MPLQRLADALVSSHKGEKNLTIPSLHQDSWYRPEQVEKRLISLTTYFFHDSRICSKFIEIIYVGDEMREK
jgi:hypothetical protein